MVEKYFLEIVINREKLSDGSAVFVANCPTFGIASQGSTVDEARENIKEAIELYLEEMPEKYNELFIEDSPLFSFIEVKRNAKTPYSIG
jgi:predicted RNase H-like HicB family nuclease